MNMRPARPLKTTRLGGAIALLTLLTGLVWAHGDFPAKHGGVLNVGGETTFEMVTRGRSIVFYLGDHGTDLSTAGAKRVVTVITATSERATDLSSAGANQLTGRLHAPLKAGDKVTARVILGNGSIVVGRFIR